jgi:antitoxin component YwqK of YwqJK toxin-antitoxin module
MIRILLFALLLPITVAAQSSDDLVQCSREAISEAEGSIIYSSGSSYTVKWDNMKYAPQAGARGQLTYYFETKVLGGKLSGRNLIGVVEALSTTQGVTEFRVLKHNGFFRTDKKINFEEHIYAKEESVTTVEDGYRSEGRSICGQRRGEWRKFAPNGKLVEVSNHDKNGNLDGPWQSFYKDSGTKETVGTYDRGWQIGTWETFLENGQLKSSKDHFVMGSKYPRKEWYPNGQLKLEGANDHKGKPIGEWKTYREDGKLVQRITYGISGQEGAVAGFKTYRESGILEEEGYWNESKQAQGELTVYYSDGSVARRAHYDAGKLNGPYKSFYANGRPASEGDYLAGAKQGLWKEYDADGKQRSEIQYDKDIYSGVWKSWHPNGAVAETGTYSEGKKSLAWQAYSLNGKLLSLHNYDGGTLSGVFQKWNEDGTISETGSYANDKLHGTFTSYFPDGKVKEAGLYENGQRVGKWVTRNEKGKKKVVKY